MAEQDELVFGAPVGTISAVANMAAAEYADDTDKQMEVIAAAWKARLEAKTKEFMKAAYKAAEVTEAAAEPVGAAGYQWWNMVVAGPFQPLAPGGPFAPRKIIQAAPVAEPAFLLAALWTNPLATPFGPGATVLMSGWNYSVWFETGNLTAWANGPDFGPFLGAFGPGSVNVISVPLVFPAPPQGRPNLYEINMTADVTGPGVVPFAGYSTWVIDPDTELPFWFLPGVGPQLQHDIPMRVLVYTA